MAVADNVSAGGARLLVGSPRTVGEVLTLEVQRPHPLAGQCLSFRVSRCEALSGGGHVIAGAFLSPLTEAQADDLAGI